MQIQAPVGKKASRDECKSLLKCCFLLSVGQALVLHFMKFFFGLLSFFWASAAICAAERPNVLFIAIDDLNDWVGFMDGHPQAQTPNMDALAKRGRNFINAHCAVPVCSASRVSVMSGVAATTHASYELGPRYEQLPALEAVPTIQGYFKHHGYYTLSGGKVLHHDFNGRLAEDIDRSLGRNRSPRPRQPMSRPTHWSGAWDWGAYPENDAEMADIPVSYTHLTLPTKA